MRTRCVAAGSPRSVEQRSSAPTSIVDRRKLSVHSDARVDFGQRQINVQRRDPDDRITTLQHVRPGSKARRSARLDPRLDLVLRDHKIGRGIRAGKHLRSGKFADEKSVQPEFGSPIARSRFAWRRGSIGPAVRSTASDSDFRRAPLSEDELIVQRGPHDVLRDAGIEIGMDQRRALIVDGG